MVELTPAFIRDLTHRLALIETRLNLHEEGIKTLSDSLLPKPAPTLDELEKELGDEE